MPRPFFGLGRYKDAATWLEKAMALPNTPAWEFESTVRQLAALAQLGCEIPGDPQSLQQSPAFQMLCQLFRLSPEALRGILVGKIGLALSGGGFRASLKQEFQTFLLLLATLLGKLIS